MNAEYTSLPEKVEQPSASGTRPNFDRRRMGFVFVIAIVLVGAVAVVSTQPDRTHSAKQLELNLQGRSIESETVGAPVSSHPEGDAQIMAWQLHHDKVRRDMAPAGYTEVYSCGFTFGGSARFHMYNGGLARVTVGLAAPGKIYSFLMMNGAGKFVTTKYSLKSRDVTANVASNLMMNYNSPPSTGWETKNFQGDATMMGQLSFTCGTSSNTQKFDAQSIYWACGNSKGLHVNPGNTFCTWDHSVRTNTHFYLYIKESTCA